MVMKDIPTTIAIESSTLAFYFGLRIPLYTLVPGDKNGTNASSVHKSLRLHRKFHGDNFVASLRDLFISFSSVKLHRPRSATPPNLEPELLIPSFEAHPVNKNSFNSSLLHIFDRMAE